MRLKSTPKKIKDTLAAAIYFLQLLLIVAIAALEYMTKKKAGVSHHLRYKKTYYLNHILSTEYRIIFAIFLALIAASVIYLIRKKQLHQTAYLSVFWSIVGMMSLLLPQVQNLLSYPYFILAVGINLLLSLIFAVVTKKVHTNN